VIAIAILKREIFKTKNGEPDSTCQLANLYLMPSITRQILAPRYGFTIRLKSKLRFV